MTDQEKPDQGPQEPFAASENPSAAETPETPEPSVIPPASEGAEAPVGEGAGGPEGAAKEEGAKAEATSGDSQKAERPRKKRKRKKSAQGNKERPSKGPSLSPEKLLEVALESLRRARADLARRAGANRIPHPAKDDALEVQLRVPRTQGGIQEAAQKLVREWRDSLEKQVLESGLLVPGRAYVFSEEGFQGDYARPMDARQVLVGYGLEGRPRYADLVSYAIEKKHEGIEELLAGKEAVVSFFEKGSTVTEGVKPAFEPENLPYVLVGQAMIGLFTTQDGNRKVALTLQVLKRDRGEEGFQLLLHPVSRVDLDDLPEVGIRKILRGFQGNLNHLAKTLAGKKAAGSEYDLEEEVLSELRGLARRLSHNAKNMGRKTEHARERSEEGRRPTQLAFPEAKTARDHHLYMDPKEGSVVVIGRGRRVHVFSPDARHITSMVLNQSQVKERVKSGRWRPAGPEERGSFREALAALEKPK
ncbi:MAG TPA: hypothetical protein ENK02_03505 [Planctomycetes bacterium]|nr:hypothetical protein [Planctomycetota bacterium]